MIIKDYYKILGFDNNKANLEEIKIAYRDMAKKYHPDVNGNNPGAEERFKDIGEAYNTLSNSKQRRKYDRLWAYYIGRNKKQSEKYKNAKTKDFMNLFFGNGEIKEENNNKTNINKERGEDINTEITATISESYYGATKVVSFKTIEGKNKKIEVKIPAGIRNDEKIRLIGQGKNGKNGGKNGDLYIKIKIKDTANIKLDGINLYTNLLITPWESALGTKIKLHGIDEELEIDVPKGAQSDEEIIINNKGYKDGKGGRGDFIAKIKIMTPKETSKEEDELFAKLNEISSFNPRKTNNS